MAPESAAAERIAKRQLIGDLALERMIELLSSPRHDSVEMPIVESVGRSRAKPQGMRRRMERFQRRDRKALPISDANLINAIAKAQKIEPPASAAVPPNRTDIVGDSVHICDSEALPYESAWIREQYGLHNPAAEALERKFGIFTDGSQPESEQDSSTAVAPEDTRPDLGTQ
jgi:hypothetical protein